MNKYHARLDRIFKKFIRLRDRHDETTGKCISCGRFVPIGVRWQAGHYHPTSCCPQPSMRFNEKNVNGQCSYCNKELHGNQDGYRDGLIRKYGPIVMTQLQMTKAMKQNPWHDFEYKTLYEHYKQKVKEIEQGFFGVPTRKKMEVVT